MPDPHILKTYCQANPGTRFARRTWMEGDRAYAEVRIIHADGRKVEVGTNRLSSEQDVLDTCSEMAIGELAPAKTDFMSGWNHARANEGARGL